MTMEEQPPYYPSSCVVAALYWFLELAPLEISLYNDAWRGII